MKDAIEILQHNLKHYEDLAKASRADSIRALQRAKDADNKVLEFQAALLKLTK